MENEFNKIVQGYKAFKKKYHKKDNSIMEMLATKGQKPKIMVVACCDSRVDPAILLQCDPGDLFIVRNVANLIPPYENDENHHGVSAALEFAIQHLKVKHLIILGHSQCGGIETIAYDTKLAKDSFLARWMALAGMKHVNESDPNKLAKLSLNNSFQNCLTFPWIQDKILSNELKVHRWYFNIKLAELFAFCDKADDYKKLEDTILEIKP